jgi:DNA polymerase-3 subunit gamma/tau
VFKISISGSRSGEKKYLSLDFNQKNFREGMENFIVSARKYRPQTFDTVIGQKSITSTLKNAIKNQQLAQAFLFCGPRGVGKTTCARILAKTINCQNITAQYEACDECPSCKSFNQSGSFNMHELDAASNNSVDDIRNLVEQVRIPPQAGKYKVYIIDEVHMLSAQAFNAFLKTLEEPPSYAKFILATTEKHKIIPTILSRCQIFDFKRITIYDIASHLAYVAEKEGIKADKDALHIIAQKSDGALRDALSIFDQIASSTEGNITYQSVIDNLNILDYEFYFTMTNHVAGGDIKETLLLIDEVIDNGFDGLQFISGFSSHLRNLLICKDEQTIRLLEVSENVKERYKEQVGKITVDFLLKALDIASHCDIEYKTSNNKRLHLELAFMQICNLSKQPVEPAETKVVTEKKTPDVIPVTEAKTPLPVVENLDKNKGKEKTTLLKSDIVSIKNLGSKDNLKEIVVSEPEEEYGNDAFSEESFREAWLRYAGGIRDMQPNFYSTLTRRMPVLKEENQIELLVDNKIQLDELQTRKGEILSYLRKELNNRKITLEVLVTEVQDETKHLAPDEKYRKMVEKNPAISKLKDQLDLEIDY